MFAIMLLCGHVYGMAPRRAVQAPVQAPVKTFLLPENAKTANEELVSLLDSARGEVLIAMYWLIDSDIINKIIDLSTRRRINVQVIFDKSTPNNEALIDRFRRNDMLPIVFPSENVKSLMHNKFLVIDNQKVWTGSANFTGKAMKPDPETGRFNHENIVVIDSREVAARFKEGFNAAKKDAFFIYINLLANNDPEALPRFVTQLSPIFYQTDPEFKEIIKAMMSDLDPSQRARLESFFPGLQERPQRPASNWQRAFLEARHSFRPGMSYEEAYRLIGQISQQQQIQQQMQQRQPTDPQRAFLEARGLYRHGMSYDEAYQLIRRIMKQ